MADPAGSGAGEHILSVVGWALGVVIGWFGSVLYMRDKFVSKDGCKECHEHTSTQESLQIQALNSRMTAVENCVGKLFEQSTANYGLITEIHGFIKAKRMEIL